jgi:hypothetical protein
VNLIRNNIYVFVKLFSNKNSLFIYPTYRLLGQTPFFFIFFPIVQRSRSFVVFIDDGGNPENMHLFSIMLIHILAYKTFRPVAQNYHHHTMKN